MIIAAIILIAGAAYFFLWALIYILAAMFSVFLLIIRGIIYLTGGTHEKGDRNDNHKPGNART